MARLGLKCKSCGKGFFSGLDLPPGVTLSGNSHQCPHCGEVNVYEQGDYEAEEAPPAKTTN